jgi:hypothetical protein
LRVDKEVFLKLEYNSFSICRRLISAILLLGFFSQMAVAHNYILLPSAMKAVNIFGITSIRSGGKKYRTDNAWFTDSSIVIIRVRNKVRMAANTEPTSAEGRRSTFRLLVLDTVRVMYSDIEWIHERTPSHSKWAEELSTETLGLIGTRKVNYDLVKKWRLVGAR